MSKNSPSKNELMYRDSSGLTDLEYVLLEFLGMVEVQIVLVPKLMYRDSSGLTDFEYVLPEVFGDDGSSDSVGNQDDDVGSIDSDDDADADSVADADDDNAADNDDDVSDPSRP